MPGHVLLKKTVFEDHGGETKMTEKSVFETVEDRGGMLKSGMEERVSKTTERFADLLRKIRKD